MITLKVRKLYGLRNILGLIGKRKSENLLLKTRFGIHTFFLKFPIDILVLDRNGRVVNLKKSLQPNKVFFWNPFYKTVLELAENTILNKKIKIGQLICLNLVQ